MKEYTVKLTEREIEILLHAIEAESAHAKMQAAQGIRDRDKTDRWTSKLCAVSSKLYSRLYEIHSKEA